MTRRLWLHILITTIISGALVLLSLPCASSLRSSSSLGPTWSHADGYRWAMHGLNDGWRLMNNIWRGGYGWQHLLFTDDTSHIGWRWAWTSPSEEVASYPALVAGARPWDPANQTHPPAVQSQTGTHT